MVPTGHAHLTDAPDERLRRDERWMHLALEVALGGAGRVSPNPLVGALVVKGGRAVSNGSHRAFGEPHAEVEALKIAGEDARGATLYVNLEPCRHEGKTPPCTRAILEAGVARVVYGARDPKPDSGGGAEELAAAGVEVVGGVLRRECLGLNAPFFKFSATGRPLVTAKWAMTLDGKLATRTGDSRWISSEASRKQVHEMRGRADAIMVGLGTATKDNPRLNCRVPELPSPLKVIVDGEAGLSPDARLLREDPYKPDPVRVLVAVVEGTDAERCGVLERAGAEVVRLKRAEGGHGVDVAALLGALAERNVCEVLCEGGARLFGSLFDAQLIDRLTVFVAPRLAGGKGAPSPIHGTGIERMIEAPILREIRTYRVEGDIVVEAKLGPWDWE